IGTAWTLSVPFWGWVARRYSVRFLMTCGFVTTAFFTALAFLLFDNPDVTSVVLVFCAFGATMLDGVGNVLFFRAVRAHQRTEMAAVFVTYRDTGQLITPGVFALLLTQFALPVVFLSASIWMLIAGVFARYIPRKLR
ncbi:MAG: MFS transporter, partial [Pseudomonadota bacterium]